MTKYPIISNYGNAIHCGAPYGPIFSNGHDIYVSDNSNANTISSVKSNGTYGVPNAANGHSILTGGNPNFKTTEVEVYLIQ